MSTAPPPHPTVLADGLLFPEGPLVDLAGDIWCVEVRGHSLCHLQQDGTLVRHDVGGAPNGLALDSDGTLWYCDALNNEIRCFEPATARVHSVIGSIRGKTLAAPNDLAFDTEGNLLFTCPGSSRQQPTGYVCCLRPNGEAMVIAEELLFPNGLAFNAAGDALYLAETYAQRVSLAPWKASSPGTLALKPVLSTPGPIGPDGLAIDAEGRVHACIYSAGIVLIHDPNGSERSVPVPGAHPTNCAFDPLQRHGLIVTEAARGTILAFPSLGPGNRPFVRNVQP